MGVQSDDEVAALASSFNHMVGRVKEYTQRLENKAKRVGTQSQPDEKLLRDRQRDRGIAHIPRNRSGTHQEISEDVDVP